VKTAGVDDSRSSSFTGPAKVFESQDAAVTAILNGPGRGGRRRRRSATKARAAVRACRKCSIRRATSSRRASARPARLITDGRFSGGTSGLSIGHVSPEAAEGGADRSGRERRPIEIDIPDRSIHLAVRRRRAGRAPQGRRSARMAAGEAASAQGTASRCRPMPPMTTSACARRGPRSLGHHAPRSSSGSWLDGRRHAPARRCSMSPRCALLEAALIAAGISAQALMEAGRTRALGEWARRLGTRAAATALCGPATTAAMAMSPRRYLMEHGVPVNSGRRRELHTSGAQCPRAPIAARWSDRRRHCPKAKCWSTASFGSGLYAGLVRGPLRPADLRLPSSHTPAPRGRSAKLHRG